MPSFGIKSDQPCRTVLNLLAMNMKWVWSKVIVSENDVGVNDIDKL